MGKGERVDSLAHQGYKGFQTLKIRFLNHVISIISEGNHSH